MTDKHTTSDNTEERKFPQMNGGENKDDQPNGVSAEGEESLQNSESAAGEIESDIEKLQKQVSESEKLVGSYKDQLLRLAAEFENFRKRTETEKNEFIKFSNERIIRDLLPVLDDFERALSNGKKNADFDSFYKGVEMIYQKLRKVFEEKGVKPIESIGKEFDVMYHDVLMQVQRPDVAPHTVVEEVERGYTLHGKVIKHAKVIVAADTEENSGTDPKN